jgi:hypothetical protein
LAELADEVLAVECSAPTAVQEVHLVAIHALCSAVERYLPSTRWAAVAAEVSP